MMHPQRNLIEAAKQVVTGKPLVSGSIAHYGEHPEYGKLYIGHGRRVTDDPERATSAIWDMGLKDGKFVLGTHNGRSSLHTSFEINGEKITDYRDERHRELMKHVNNTPVSIVPPLNEQSIPFSSIASIGINANKAITDRNIIRNRLHGGRAERNSNLERDIDRLEQKIQDFVGQPERYDYQTMMYRRKRREYGAEIERLIQADRNKNVS